MRGLVLSVFAFAALLAACDQRGAVTIGGDAGAAGESIEPTDTEEAGAGGTAE